MALNDLFFSNVLLINQHSVSLRCGKTLVCLFKNAFVFFDGLIEVLAYKRNLLPML